MKLRRLTQFATKHPVLFAFIIVLLIILWLVTAPPTSTYVLVGGIEGHPEYCTHFVTDLKGIRLAITPFAFPDRADGRQIDPNNWRHEPLAHDYMPFGAIVVPYVDYEVTHDGGITWKQFWRYDNQINESPWCDAFDSLDENNFWIWVRSGIAITHDGGFTWIIQNGYEKWNTGGNMVIDYVQFDSPSTGRIVFVQWPNKPDPTLFTKDGGLTWFADK